MQDLIGRTLGHYRIVEKIGEGGMGVVYRARDERLDRDVAVKVLPEEVAGVQDRLERFEREAKLLASLNHPNIATLYGLEEEESQRFLVMELVEGESLANVIARGKIPFDEALPIALQIAKALETAHENGVIHRDLKPANVMIDSERQVKVLDFGLAKAFDPEASSPQSPESIAESPTLTAEMTRAGTLLGTAAYMSPEQASGKPVDKRADIWAFGCVLFEMLTGTRAFGGATSTEVLAGIIKEEPAWDELPANAPPPIRRLLRRCLAKDPRYRVHDIADARIVIEEGDSPVRYHEHSPGALEETPGWRRAIPWLVAAGLAVLVAVFALLWWRVVRAPRPLVRSTIESPPGARLRPQRGFALSPDGRRLAFVARDAEGVNSLWVRSLAARSARPVAQTEGAWKPFWSPDGRNVAFFDGASLKRVPAAGGVVQTLAEASDPRGGTWSPEGRIVFSERRTGLLEVPATGGEPKALTAVDGDAGELDHRWPIFLRDGRTVLFLVQTGEAGARDDQSRIEALDPDGARHPVLRLNSSVAYAPPGQLLFWREGSVYVQELDRRGLRARGEPRLVAESVTFTENEWAALSVSGEGTLVYHREQDLPWRLEWRDRSGRLVFEAAPEGEYSYPALSPDGQRVAYVADHVVWVLDLARGTSTRLSYEEVDHYQPFWAPDGHWVYFVADRSREKGQELLRRPSSGLGEREVVYTAGQRIYGGSWSPDGRRVVIEEGGALLSLDLETGESRSLVRTPGWASHAQLSPDGRWLAYASDESGRDEVFVEPASGEEERWQVSRRGGYMPAWAPDGEELFFLGLDNELRVVELDLRGTPEFGLPESLFSLPGALFGVSYQVGSDGRILVRVQPSGGGAESLTLIQGWSQLLEASGH